MNWYLLYLVLALFSGYMHTQDALNQLHQQYYTSYLYQPCTFKAEDAPPTVSFKYGLCTTESHNGDRTHHQTPIYSPQIALAQICHAWSEPQFADTIEHCIEYYVSCGYSRDDAHEHILKQHALYLFPSFIKNIKKLSGYRPYIKNLHQHLLNKQGKYYRARKMFGFINRGYIKLRAITDQLYNEIIAQEKTEAAHHATAQKRKAQQDLCNKQEAIRIKHNNVHETFAAQRDELRQESHDWHKLLEIYKDEQLSNTTRIEQRIQALNIINNDQIKYTEQSYKLSTSATKLLPQTDSDATVYTTHYGNQLQHVIHQECIDGIERCATLQLSSMMYPYQQGIAHCFDAAREFNEIGQTNKATAIADFCWALLDCGLAIAEGAVDGVVGAVKDLAEHSVQAVICAVAGQYVLAYQLSKVLYNVADIGITALTDTDRAAQKWDEYIAPITQIIDAIEHQQITVRDALKGATHLAVQWKVQGKLLKGLGNICTTAKNRALEFAQKYPLSTPQDYMATPEGILLKSIDRGVEPEEQLVEQLRKKLERSKNPAHGTTQYHYLKKDLLEEQYTNIIKCTKHGLQRLMERFTPEEVAAIVKNPDIIKQQQDGARTLIKQFGERYSIIVLNPQNETITGLSDIDQRAMTKLGKNYGWE